MIDMQRIRNLEQEYLALDPLEAYYRKRSLTFELECPLVPSTRVVLERALRGVSYALDIGCGDGRTLLDYAHSFRAAVGFDDSGYALDLAIADAQRRGITNVEFRQGKAIELPFQDAVFDFVFSERGPIGHTDCTMIEALRMLKPGGRIFYETGAWAGADRTLLTNLDEERDRLERLGVVLEILASRVEPWRFDNLYVWFEMQCIIGRYLEQAPPFPYTQQSLEEMATSAGGTDQPIVTSHQTIWVGGQKSPAK